MVLDRVRQIDCVLLSGDQSEAEDVRVVLGLLVEIRRLVACVRYLPHSDHADSSLSFVFWISKSSKPRENLHGRGEAGGYFDAAGAAQPPKKTLTAIRTVSSILSRLAARGMLVSQLNWCSPISMSRNRTASRYGSSSIMRPSFCCLAIHCAPLW